MWTLARTRTEKPLAYARGFFWGEGVQALSPSSGKLFRWRLIRRSRGRSKLFQIVLQKAYFYAPTAGSLGLGLVIGVRARHRSIAHAYHVNPVDRYVVVQHEVSHHGIRHLLRGGNGGLAVAGGEALHFDNVAALALQRSRHIIEGGFGVLAQDALA